MLTSAPAPAPAPAEEEAPAAAVSSSLAGSGLTICDAWALWFGLGVNDAMVHAYAQLVMAAAGTLEVAGAAVAAAATGAPGTQMRWRERSAVFVFDSFIFDIFDRRHTRRRRRGCLPGEGSWKRFLNKHDSARQYSYYAFPVYRDTFWLLNCYSVSEQAWHLFDTCRRFSSAQLEEVEGQCKAVLQGLFDHQLDSAAAAVAAGTSATASGLGCLPLRRDVMSASTVRHAEVPADKPGLFDSGVFVLLLLKWLVDPLGQSGSIPATHDPTLIRLCRYCLLMELYAGELCFL
jgi:hypothetical protein